MAIQTKKSHGAFSQLRHYATTLLAIGLLLFSWYVWYFLAMALTEDWGAPWDTSTVRPPTENWQRTLNDFFESGIGAYLPTGILLASTVFLYIRTVVRTRHLQAVTIVFAVTNLLALILLFFVAYPLQANLMPPPPHLTPDDWSYWGDFRREWPVSLAGIVCFAALFLLQPHLLRRYLRLISSGSPDHRGNSSS